MKYNIPGFLFEIFNNKILPEALSLLKSFKGMEHVTFQQWEILMQHATPASIFKFKIYNNLETDSQLFIFHSKYFTTIIINL